MEKHLRPTAILGLESNYLSAGGVLYHIYFLLLQIRLGSSSRSPTIAGLVLEHLCPAIQNILEDGLRDHKLDLVIGQRRNNSWSVVEVSTRMGKCNQSDRVSKECPVLMYWWSSIARDPLFVVRSQVFWVTLCNRSIHQGPSQPGLQN